MFKIKRNIYKFVGLLDEGILMRQKIIEMIFCANQSFIVHSPRLRSLVATRHAHLLNITRYKLKVKIERNIYKFVGLLDEGILMRQKIIEMIFCANQSFIVHSPRLRSLVATRHAHLLNITLLNKS